MSSLTTLGSRISRHSAVYLAGSGSTLLAGLVSVAVLTRFLSTSEYGLVAVLLVFSTVLTVIYNLGSLQGSFSWVFGGFEDEGAIADSDAGPTAAGKREALGTALAFISLTAVGGTLLVVAGAPLLADAVTGDRGNEDAVIIAGVAGGLGGIWRLVSNVPRLERRPVLYNALATVRPVLVLGLSVALVAAGYGVNGAIGGVAAGTALSIVVGLAFTWRSYRPAFRRHDVVQILRHGRPMIPIIISFWILQQSDVLLLSQYVPDDDVALYRVASRIAAIMSYFVSAFLMAWLPLSRTSAAEAVKRERGAAAMNSMVMTYYLLAALGLLLALALAAEALIEIAPPEYSDAAVLIPLLALGFVGYGCYLVLYRITSFPGRRVAYVAFAVLSAVIFNLAALALLPVFDSYGAAAAFVIGNSFGALGLLVLSQRGPRPVPFEYGRIASGVALAGICFGVGHGLAQILPEGAAAAVKAVMFIAYPVLLIRLGVIPPEHIAPLRRILRSLLPDRSPARELEVGLERLPPLERAVLDAMVARRTDREVESGEPAPSVEALAAVRQLTGYASVPTEHDDKLADFLFSPVSVAERDAMARELWASGVDPAELDRLESIVLELGRIRRRSGPLAPDDRDVMPPDATDLDAPVVVRSPADRREG